ncbi:hypothetical protein CEXT_197541 [Caerostris extrusa]|uniref:Uncharacterized protein n=1 Tax=Caerostris extrusa TaxID=172846 RepID=A0AAV4Y623_CAEEX|nr:hypothetical protein CEXT_197541 [Caerostris extrusa]
MLSSKMEWRLNFEIFREIKQNTNGVFTHVYSGVCKRLYVSVRVSEKHIECGRTVEDDGCLRPTEITRWENGKVKKSHIVLGYRQIMFE